MSFFPRPIGVLVLALACAGNFGCTDRGKVSAEKAVEHATFLQLLVEKDVAEVRSGMPEGATKLVPVFAKGADARDNPVQLKKQLGRVRNDVKGLFVAKSTFLVLVDEKGVALRNEFEPDAIAGRDLRKSIPAMEPVFSGKPIEFHGAFPEFAGVKDASRDRVWIAATPIPVEAGGSAALITGWSYRLFARHLQESLKREILEAARAGKGKEPLYYVGVFDETGVFMAPGTPQLDEDILAKENLVQKTQSGPFHAPITITDRAFGYAAARTPTMGNDVGVVVLRSEI